MWHTLHHRSATVKGDHRLSWATTNGKCSRFDSAAYLSRLLDPAIAGPMAELNKAQICRRIAEAREQAGLTQAKLAAALGVSTRSIQDWERGTTAKQGHHRWTVPFDRLEEIGRILGVSKEWLLEGKERLEDGDRLEALEALVDRGFEKVLDVLERLEARVDALAAGQAALPKTELPGR